SSCRKSSRRSRCARIIRSGEEANDIISRRSPGPRVSADPVGRIFNPSAFKMDGLKIRPTRRRGHKERVGMPVQLAETAARDGADKDYLWTLNFGPQHPATHTTLRLVLTLDGETVVKAVPDIGYLHSGFEKLGEELDYNQYVTIVDRMNYISPVANEIAWHHAVEKLLDIEITPRCSYIRTIFAELMRIHDHLLCCGAAALDLGGFTAFLYAFN